MLHVASAGPPIASPSIASPPIIDRPIPYGPERQRLTEVYLQAHRGEAALTGDVVADTTMTPQLIVLHWTGGGSAEGAFATFAPTRLRGRPALTDAGAVNVSAHFLVDRDGTIYQLMDETRVGRHTIGLNHLAVGIENVGDGARYPLTQAQVDADAALVTWLVARHPSITHLIGHHEYRAMEGHPYFEERDAAYRTVKSEPAADLVAQARAPVAGLGLSGPL